MKSGDKDAIVVELEQPVQALQRTYKAENHSADAKQKCANRTAALATETAMAWHLEAVGSQGQRGTGDPKTMDLAALLYKKVAETWNADDFSKFEFPRLVKEDWPHDLQDQIQHGRPPLLPREVGRVRSGVRRRRRRRTRRHRRRPRPRTPRCSATRTSTSRSTQKGADKKGSGNLPGVGKDIKQDSDDKYRPKDMTDAQKAMVQSFNRYVCYIHPDKNDADGQKQLVEVKYARCRLYFEAQHWEEAAACFKDIAYDHSDNDSARLRGAALPREHQRPHVPRHRRTAASCLDDMITDVPKFLDLFCTGDKVAKNEESCTLLTKVQCDIQRLRAQTHRRGRRQGRQQRARALREGRQGVLRPLGQVRRHAASGEPAAAVREARRDRRERRARLPGRPPRRERHPRAHGPAQSAVTGWRRPSSPRTRCSRSAATTRPSRSTTRRRTGTSGTRRRTRTGRTPTRRSRTRSSCASVSARRTSPSPT